MYSVTETPVSKILFVQKASKKVFTSGGKIVKLDKNGIAVLPADAKIAACKISHFVLHQVRMAKNRQILHIDATIEKYGLGEKIGLDEEELLLASLEVLEVL